MITYILTAPAVTIDPGSTEIAVSFTSTNPDQDMSDTFKLYLNYLEVVAVITEDAGVYTLTATEFLEGGNEVVVTAEGSDKDGWSSDHWNITVNPEALFSDEQYFVSSYLDKMLTYFPSYTKARTDRYSLTRQFLNPIALKLEENLTRLTTMNRAMSLTNLNNDEPTWLYEHRLEDEESFPEFATSSGESRYIPPRVWGYRGVNRVELTAAEGFREMWYEALPSLYEVTDLDKILASLTPSIKITSLRELSVFDVPLPGKLWIEVHSATNLFNLVDQQFTIIRLEGQGPTGKIQAENLRLFKEGTTSTALEWSRVEKVLLVRSPEEITGELVIYNAPRRAIAKDDKLNIYLDENEDKKLTWSLGSDSLGSFLTTTVSGEGDIFDIVKGINTAKTLEYYRLADTTGVAITVDDFCLSSLSNRMFGIDKDQLYIWDRRDPHHSNLSALTGQTTDPEVNFFLLKYSQPTPVEGDLTTEITIELDTPKSGKIVRRWYWAIINSDNSRLYIDRDKNLTALSPVWIENPTPTEFFGINEKSFTIDMVGTGDFVAELVVDFRDHEQETTRIPFQIYNKIALAEYSLDHRVTLNDDISTIYLDNHGELFIINRSKAYRLTPVYNAFIPDYSNNRILMREEYDSVEVSLNES